MTSTNPKILQELKEIAGDWDDYPRNASTEVLEFITESERFEGWFQRDAFTELNIRRHGFHICAIKDDNDKSENPRPTFCYTVGLERLGLPELLTYYPSASSVHHVFHDLYQRMMKREISPPSTIADVVHVDGAFDNEDLKVALTLLSPEECDWAYQETTCQVSSEETPIALVHIPYPSGHMPMDLIPEELLKGIQG